MFPLSLVFQNTKYVTFYLIAEYSIITGRTAQAHGRPEEEYQRSSRSSTRGTKKER